MTLADLGWSTDLESAFAPALQQGWVPARLIRDNKISYGALVVTEEGGFEEWEAILSGKVYHDASSDAELPAVGDWVALDLEAESDAGVIRSRLPRRTCFSRKAAGKSTEEQVIAANVDTVLVVTEPGSDFNPRRLERYFTLIHRSGARPAVILNKSDLYDGARLEECHETIRTLDERTPIHTTSVLEGSGLEVLQDYLHRGETIAFIGSSGVGKSAMINHLLGDAYQWTSEVNEVTGKGRHTTTARELMVLKGGGIVVDNPGIKEVHMWTDETTLREHFADVFDLAARCRFSDCKHGADKGCAIRAAVEAGELEPGRYEGFLKLEDEIESLRRKRKKRQMTLERRGKRDRKVKARNPADRRDLERALKPKASRDSDPEDAPLGQ